jgi:hypothetical protein
MHMHIIIRRQALQDKLITELLSENWAPSSASGSTAPWIVFTCGAMGAGKSHVVGWMQKNRHFPLPSLVRIDADIFRHRLPEWRRYATYCPASAGLLTHLESGYCVEILQEAALRAQRNIWVDGSLRNITWYVSVFEDLRKRHPHYRIALFIVEASKEIVQARASSRAAKTQRFIPEKDILHSLASIPRAAAELSPKVDLFVRILNEECNGTPKLLESKHRSRDPDLVGGVSQLGGTRAGAGSSVAPSIKSSQASRCAEEQNEQCTGVDKRRVNGLKTLRNSSTSFEDLAKLLQPADLHTTIATVELKQARLHASMRGHQLHEDLCRASSNPASSSAARRRLSM